MHMRAREAYWFPEHECSTLLMRTSATESVTLVRADEKLTAFIELESAGLLALYFEFNN